jgi:hypothetical protein
MILRPSRFWLLCVGVRCRVRTSRDVPFVPYSFDVARIIHFGRGHSREPSWLPCGGARRGKYAAYSIKRLLWTPSLLFLTTIISDSTLRYSALLGIVHLTSICNGLEQAVASPTAYRCK